MVTISRTWLAAILPLALGGCQTVNAANPFAQSFPHGKVALCPAAASIGPAVIVVTDLNKNRPGVETVPRDTAPDGVCAAVNAAAHDAGFTTVFNDPHDAGVKILSDDPDRIKIEYQNVRLVVQDF